MKTSSCLSSTSSPRAPTAAVYHGVSLKVASSMTAVARKRRTSFAGIGGGYDI